MFAGCVCQRTTLLYCSGSHEPRSYRSKIPPPPPPFVPPPWSSSFSFLSLLPRPVRTTTRRPFGVAVLLFVPSSLAELCRSALIVAERISGPYAEAVSKRRHPVDHRPAERLRVVPASVAATGKACLRHRRRLASACAVRPVERRACSRRGPRRLGVLMIRRRP